jgi:5-methylcytosine-specific restriction endonuclease McrA
MARTWGRKGRPWRRIHQQVLDDHGRVCHICGHGGAGDVDHVIPIERWRAAGGHPNDPANLKPAHGAHSRCPTCRRCCNNAKGDREHTPQAPASRAW